MNSDQLPELLRYRIEQAHEGLSDAKTLFANGSLRGTINRAYYAMFYAVLALLATRQLGTSKHSGAIALFDREFVKTGIFSTELSKTLHLAFDRRQTHDYGELIELDKQAVEETLQTAQHFVLVVTQYLDEAGYKVEE